MYFYYTGRTLFCYHQAMQWKIPLSFIILGFAIGFFFTSQLRTDIPVNSLFPADQIEARTSLIKTYTDEEALAQNRISSLRASIADEQKKNESLISPEKLDLLDNLKKNIGITALDGAGIRIFLNDSASAKRDSLNFGGDQSLVQASDLRDIVNLLWAAHAQGIAINQQRIISVSSITALGSSVLVNNSYLHPPFTINALGDSNLFRQRMLDPRTLTSLKRRSVELQMPFQITSDNAIHLPGFTGNIHSKHLESL
jgi:uncharacterized protein YlxW (UPF0749 family)